METKTINLWQNFVSFNDERPSPQTMMENDRLRVIVAGLKAGQRIPVHAEAAAVYHFLEGSGTMIVDGLDYPVRAGSVIVMEKGAQRGLLADTQLVFMAVRLA